ncbi:Apc15p protein-domain-containing protein [Xylariaceae sp. FL0255]|nr:Apc15p protein-domain-containing protein [Xylariaceae sp. FL0255]
MFSLLPDLTPRDSHSLWYTSSRDPLSSQGHNSLHQDTSHDQGGGGGHHHNQQHPSRRAANAHLLERSLLARLRADEANIERRRANVTNFGAAWLKPPGLPKTLHQLREERREAEEHQETLRREQLAQELAEAEAAGAETAAADEDGGGAIDAVLDDVLANQGEGEEGGGGVLGGRQRVHGAGSLADADGDEGMDDVQLDGTRDLDEDIPEAEEADFGLSDNDVTDEDITNSNSNASDEDEEDEDLEPEEREMAAAQAAQQHLMAQRMRHGGELGLGLGGGGRDSAGFYGVDEDIDDEDQSQMLEEEDLIDTHHHPNHRRQSRHVDEDDMNMDADLDDDIPEAESMGGGYEHTDTEADLSTSDDGGGGVDFPPPSHYPGAPQQQRVRFRQSLAGRSDATRNSIAISDILSRDGSSVIGSSPQVQRQFSSSSRRGGGGRA